MTLKELQAEYNKKRKLKNISPNFEPKKFDTKPEAIAALDAIEVFEEKLKKEKAKNKPMAGQRADGSLNNLQRTVLSLFGRKKKLVMSALKEAYMVETGKEKATIIPAQVGIMSKLGLLTKEGEKDEAVVFITDKAREALKATPQTTPEKKEKAKDTEEKKSEQKEYAPLFTDEALSNMKKKKRKKALKKEAENKEAWDKENK